MSSAIDPSPPTASPDLGPFAIEAARFPFSLDKWYVDALLADGSVLLLYVGQMHLCGASWPRVTAEWFPPRGPVVRGAANTLAAAGREGDRVWFETPTLSGDLSMKPRHGPVVPLDPVIRTGSRTLHWTVEVPDADVAGTLRAGNDAWPIEGRGYCDRVRMNLLPWRFPIRRLVWGHASAGPHASVWLELETNEGTISARWEDGVLGTSSATIDESTPFLDAHVLDLEGLSLGPCRSVLKWLSGDPHEVKMRAEARIGGDTGRAVHEVVRWR